MTKKLGQVVRQLRKEKKLTLQQLADSIEDYDAGNLSRFERDVQGISEPKLKEISSALGTTVSTIYAIRDGETISHEIRQISPGYGVDNETPKPKTSKEAIALLRNMLSDLSDKELVKFSGAVESLTDELSEFEAIQEDRNKNN